MAEVLKKKRRWEGRGEAEIPPETGVVMEPGEGERMGEG